MTKLEKILGMPYEIEVSKELDGDGYLYHARCKEVPEATTHSKDPFLLYVRMKEVLELSIESRMKHGEEIPTPYERGGVKV